MKVLNLKNGKGFSQGFNTLFHGGLVTGISVLMHSMASKKRYPDFLGLKQLWAQLLDILGEIKYFDWFICTMWSFYKYNIWFQDCSLDNQNVYWTVNVFIGWWCNQQPIRVQVTFMLGLSQRIKIKMESVPCLWGR